MSLLTEIASQSQSKKGACALEISEQECGKYHPYSFENNRELKYG